MNTNSYPCITLIGMPGAGKTTTGAALADKLGWRFMDTDNLIEALYAVRLQDITDALGKEAFLDMEAEVIQSITAGNCVIATGGSVVYRKKAIIRLAALGPVVYLKLPLEVIKERIASNPERGIAMAPGQTLEHIYEERKELYEHAATICCHINGLTPEDCASRIISSLPDEVIAKRLSCDIRLSME